ncbi:hypothetical protein [Natrarchaeobaculum sulfurireducens]|uniref:hypothetical protein n=1 Tax=Natrarchaeobaculum sulfurireducens TaxID=2044521 RepID=UPI00105AB0D2|nr:hypothetical protein [Natrarchaeobaculum sulfurireducens]
MDRPTTGRPHPSGEVGDHRGAADDGETYRDADDHDEDHRDTEASVWHARFVCSTQAIRWLNRSE